MINSGTAMRVPETAFVLPGIASKDLERFRHLDLDNDWHKFTDGVTVWIVQTYLILKAAGAPVSLVGNFSKKSINVAHVVTLKNLARPRGCFVLGVRADYPRIRWCKHYIVQNKTQIDSNSTWVPHWPQPGLITRDPSRASRVEKIGYFGRAVNHYTRFFRKASGWFKVKQEIQGVCEALGLDLVHRDMSSWNDYSDIDVVVGLRSFGKESYDTKPPSKLINSWISGSVFVGGNDSSFQQIGVPGKDYIICLDQKTLFHELGKLQNNTSYFEKFSDAGSQSISKFSRDSIIQSWFIALNEFFK